MYKRAEISLRSWSTRGHASTVCIFGHICRDIPPLAVSDDVRVNEECENASKGWRGVAKLAWAHHHHHHDFIESPKALRLPRFSKRNPWFQRLGSSTQCRAGLETYRWSSLVAWRNKQIGWVFGDIFDIDKVLSIYTLLYVCFYMYIYRYEGTARCLLLLYIMFNLVLKLICNVYVMIRSCGVWIPDLRANMSNIHVTTHMMYIL